MIHIHPFPARMAPEIALDGLRDLPDDYVILDPMSGSGMVLSTAAKLGLSAIGYDLDPLACLITKANGTRTDENATKRACEELLHACTKSSNDDVVLSWVDQETRAFMNFWFGPSQSSQLRKLSYHLLENPFSLERDINDLIKVAISRLIISKEPKASLARDTAHSRPHRTIVENDFDVFAALPKSLNHVLKALDPRNIRRDVRSYRGDARSIGGVKSASIDRIVTSPPYLNAIDYMRGHKLSLVWFGFSISNLRAIRAKSIGAEIGSNSLNDALLHQFFADLHPDVDARKRRILQKYFQDLSNLTKEAYRVLKRGRKATYVIGNSCVKGHEVKNSDLLIISASKNGFRLVEQTTRDIPENRRYLPLLNSHEPRLSGRMRSEHVLTFVKD